MAYLCLVLSGVALTLLTQFGVWVLKHDPEDVRRERSVSILKSYGLRTAPYLPASGMSDIDLADALGWASEQGRLVLDNDNNVRGVVVIDDTVLRLRLGEPEARTASVTV